jgi:hypothetical protein
MTNLLADFEWYRDRNGYCLKKFEDGRFWISPKNASPTDWIKYRPFARGGDLCIPFSEVRDKEQLLRFVTNNGPLASMRHPHHARENRLTEPIWVGDLLAYPREPTEDGLEAAKIFRKLLDLKARRAPKQLASFFKSQVNDFIFKRVSLDQLQSSAFYAQRMVRSWQQLAGFASGEVGDSVDPAFGMAGIIDLVADSEKGVRIRLSPQTLFGALWYQLGVKLSNSDLRICRFQDCNRMFEVGNGTGKRTDSEFCCREHKVRHLSLDRSKRRKGTSSEKRRD